MKSGFTMIELIFVIVILGLLSAIALPKMLGVQKSAHAQKVESFVSTMNRTTLPSMYLASVRDGGSIKSLKLSDYIDLPKEVISLDLSKCGLNAFSLSGSTTIGAKIYCRDGGSSVIPMLSFDTTDSNTTLDSTYFK